MLPTLEQVNSFNRGTIIEEIGLTITKVSENSLEGEMPYSKKVTQPFGLIHGGIYCVISESLASIGSNLILEKDEMAVGQSLSSQHLRPISSGVLKAVAQLEHKGKTSHIWDIKIYDQQNKLVHVSRMQMAIRKKP
ncbi:MAG: hotdog fold thioesterase [Bdellovibrio sp.]